MRDSDRAIGDLDFDPLGLRPDRYIPEGDRITLSGSMDVMQTRELNNGRTPPPRLEENRTLTWPSARIPRRARRHDDELPRNPMRAACTRRPRDDRNQRHGRSGAHDGREALLEVAGTRLPLGYGLVATRDADRHQYIHCITTHTHYRKRE
jgi:hypothetical protein